MRALLPSPVKGYRGRLAGTPIVFFMRDGRCFWRYQGQQENAATSEQLMQRGHFRAATQYWSAGLTQQERDKWQEWALVSSVAGRRPSLRGKAGYLAYCSAQQIMQAMGEGLGTAAPILQGPMPVTDITGRAAQPGDEGTTFRFRVSHVQNNTEGYFLQIKTTAAMPTLKRHPRPRDYRLVCGVRAESFLPLRVSGEDYVVNGAQFDVPAGRFYGLQIRVVTREGIAGRAMSRRIMKLENETEGLPS